MRVKAFRPFGSSVRTFALLALGAIAFCRPAFAHAQQADGVGTKTGSGIGATVSPVAPITADVTIPLDAKIEPGCLLRVEVTDEAQLSGEYDVDAQGAIHFTLADEQGKHKEEWSVTVGQKTAEEARLLVTESLKTYLRKPDVHVILLKRPRLRVELAGSGCKPGVLELPLEARLSDIMFACKQNADYTHILLVRKLKSSDKQESDKQAKDRQDAGKQNTNKPGTDTQNAGMASAKTVANTEVPTDGEQTPATRALTVNFEDYQQGQSGDDPKLENGDKIYIQMKPPGAPEHVLRTIRVVGEVGREVDIPLSKGMTVKDALERAGGLKDTADPNNIRLHRGESGKDYELKAAGILDEDAAVNMVLEPGDYLIAYKRDLSMRWGIDGEVMAGNVFPYVPGFKMTITHAVSVAGGLTKRAEHHRGILRKGYLLNPTKTRDIIFDYDAIKNKKQQDFEVEAGDVVVILQRQHRPTIWQKLLPLALKFLPLPI